jgi:hypothetical protein
MIVCLPGTIPGVGTLIGQHPPFGGVPVNPSQLVKSPISKSALAQPFDDCALTAEVFPSVNRMPRESIEANFCKVCLMLIGFLFFYYSGKLVPGKLIKTDY